MTRTKASLLTLLIVFLLSGCATTEVRKPVTFSLDHLPTDQTILVTTKDQALIQTLIPDFGEKSERLSLVIEPSSSAYPIDLETSRIYGVLETTYPKVAVNTALLWSSKTTKQGSDDLPFFRMKKSPLELYSPKNGKVLFSLGEYSLAYALLSAPSGKILPADIAPLMKESAIALYAENPQTFFDLDLGLSEEVIRQSESILLLFDEKEENTYALHALITMEDEKKAKTLSQLVRSGYLANLKKANKSYVLSELMKMFLLDGQVVTIKGIEIEKDDLFKILSTLDSFL
ncbi:MAG: hypothetical protein WC954_01920 [Sphaerochaeta sp.]